MAKSPRNEPTTADVNAASTQPVDTQAQAAATPASDERYKMVTDPETGQLTKRQDYIRKLWQEKKMKRGDIAKHLSEISGKKVPYQIVFAATKKMAGGPDPAQAATEGQPAPTTAA
jgi:hypothetical protein